MKTIIAFSDTHGDRAWEKLKGIMGESDYVFFLGDGINGLGSFAYDEHVYAVRGNCDRSALPEEQIVTVDGIKILLTHGHLYHTKRDLLTLTLRAKELDCSVVFYGHTHFASIDECNGITLICPGSPSYPLGGNPSYVYAIVTGGKLITKIVEI